MAAEPAQTIGNSDYTVQVNGPFTVAELRDALANMDEDMEVQSLHIGFTMANQSPLQALSDAMEGSQQGTVEEEGQGEEQDGEATTTTEDTADTGSTETTGDVSAPEDPTIDDIDFDQIDAYEYTTLQKVASGEGIKGNMKREEIVSELRDQHSGGTNGSDRSDRLPVRPGQDPYAVLKVLEDDGDWTLTQEIRDSIPDDWDVNKDLLLNTLWQLEDRGLVEKQKHEADKRKKEYRITETGESAFEKATAAADDGQLPAEASA